MEYWRNRQLKSVQIFETLSWDVQILWYTWKYVRNIWYHASLLWYYKNDIWYHISLSEYDIISGVHDIMWLWYHTSLPMISWYNIHDIICMITYTPCMISYEYDIIHHKTWYHMHNHMIWFIWYHSHMISYVMCMISYTWYHIGYNDIVFNAIWYHGHMISYIWYHGYGTMISWVQTYDIMVRHMIS